MSRLRRRTIAVAIVALLLLATAWLLRPRAVAVELGQVSRGRLEVAIEDEGQTRIHPRYVVAAPVAGNLAQIELDPGDSVEAGSVVARLAPTPLDARSRAEAAGRVQTAVAARLAAEADVAGAQAAAAQASSTQFRYRALADAGQLSAEELDRATTDASRLARALDGARQRAVAARYEVATARGALLDADSGATILVRAPMSGKVLRLLEDSERVVPAGAPLLELGDPADLELVVEVLSTDAVGIPVGAAMSAEAGGGRLIPARVREIEPAAFTKISPLGVEEQRVRVIGVPEAGGERDVAADPLAGLGDRFRIRARIVLWRGDSVLRAPSGALFRAGEGWAAFRYDGGRARLAWVEVGHRGSDAVEILDGLAEGDRLVLYPGARVVDGTRVRPLPGVPAWR